MTYDTPIKNPAPVPLSAKGRGIFFASCLMGSALAGALGMSTELALGAFELPQHVQAAPAAGGRALTGRLVADLATVRSTLALGKVSAQPAAEGFSAD